MDVTIANNIFHASGDGYDYVTDHEKVTVRPGVRIRAGGNGVASDQAASTLVNNGFIFAPHDLAVGFGPATDNSEIINTITGLMIGGEGAVMEGGGSEVFGNYGLVSGRTGNGLDFGNAPNSFTNLAVLFVNHGTDIGASNGVHVNIGEGETVAVKINNYNAIKGGGHGIKIAESDYANLSAVINNFSGGIIRGAHAAIDSGNGALTIHNYGEIVGNIVNASPAYLHDVVINRGEITGTVHLGSGNDLFDGGGGTSGAIYANGGNDHIICGKGDVGVHLGTGSDTATAGPGHDRFFFDKAPAGQVDIVLRFDPSLDRMELSQSAFPGIGPLGGLAAADFRVSPYPSTASPYIIYNPHNGFLLYDPHNGHPQIHFATIGAHLALTHSDFLVEP